MGLPAGSLDRRITLQRATVAQDETGQEVQTWADVTTVWASRRRASARETLAASEVAAAITDVFEIRYNSSWSAIDPTWRLIFDGRYYEIVEVSEIDRRVGIRITAIARADVPLIEDDLPPTDGPALIFSIASNSQYIGQVA